MLRMERSYGSPLATDEKNMAQHYKALDAEMGFESRIFNSCAPSTTTHSCLKKTTLITFLISYQQMRHSPS